MHRWSGRRLWVGWGQKREGLRSQAKIQTLGWAGLRDLWTRIQNRDTPDWDPGKAFEYLVLRIFQLDGAVVRWPYRVTLLGEHVEQIDGVVVAAGLHAMVESKDQNDPVAIEPVAKLRNQLMRRPVATIGMVISRSGYTDPALILASYLSEYLACVMDGTPDANITSPEIR